MLVLFCGVIMFYIIVLVWVKYLEEMDYLDLGMDSDGDTVSFEAVVIEFLEFVINIVE